MALSHAFPCIGMSYSPQTSFQVAYFKSEISLPVWSDFDPKNKAKIARYSKKFYSAGSWPAIYKFSFGPRLTKNVVQEVWDAAPSRPA